MSKLEWLKSILGKRLPDEIEVIAEEFDRFENLRIEQDSRITELEQRLAEAEAKIPKWIPVSERMPKDKKPIYMIALVPERNYTTDQYAGWYILGEWSRWPHRFPPTHWSYQIDNPEGDL